MSGEGRQTGAGGLEIYWRSWLPEAQPPAVIAIAHGLGEHSGRYGHVAARLVAEGYAVYALDHRGHGRSAGPRALVDRMDHLVSDLDMLVVTSAAAHPGIPVFLLGHSMGGALALRYAIAHQDRLAGLVLSGPLAAMEPASAPARLAARVLSAAMPRLPVLAIDPVLVSRDPAVVSAYVEDPLVYHGKLPVRTVAEIAAAVGSFPESVRAIQVPTLIMYGSEDRLCPPAGSVMLAERIGAPDLTIKAYDGLHHEILNEPEQDRVLDDMCAWLAARVPVAA